MNPFLRTLGFSPTDRVVVLHADDIGMCQATLPAYADLLDAGLISSAAAMVPCPWFNAVAELCRRRAGDGRLDMGVHLTLTAEWTAYRWRPLSTADPASGLLDGEGCFPARALPVQQAADLDAVRRELVAQIERALAAGIDVTHVDSHMLTLFQPRLSHVYIEVAQRFGVPPLLVRIPASWLIGMGYSEDEVEAAERQIDDAALAGLPVFDYLAVLSLDEYEDRLGEIRRVLDEAPAGLSMILFHPAVDTPELRAIAPDWRCRVADYRLFSGDNLRPLLDAAGVHVIGYRALRDAMRARNA
ncbi:MAG: polysaccharide deacetylase family protein [Caldilineales bacterium]